LEICVELRGLSSKKLDSTPQSYLKIEIQFVEHVCCYEIMVYLSDSVEIPIRLFHRKSNKFIDSIYFSLLLLILLEITLIYVDKC
jgi:hypothetical protein